MRYIGIDPSTKTGFVILNHYGKVDVAKEITSKEKQDPHRFIDIAKQIMECLTWKDEPICIEGFSYGSKGKGVSTQYGLGWIIRAELIKNGYSYVEVSPSALKKFATGKGNVKKDAMVLPIFKHWNFEHDSDNVRDAYVLAQIARGVLMDESDKLLHEYYQYQLEVLEKVSK